MGGDARGFTLVEIVVAIGIVSLVVGMFGAGIFQVLSTQRFWTDEVKATKDLRHAASWFAGDSLNAEDVFDASGVTRLTCAPNPNVDNVTLVWTDNSGTLHNANYRLSGAELVREYDSSGNLVAMARGVVTSSVNFSLCSSVLSLKMDVNADRGTTQSLDIRTLMRKLN